MDTEAIVKLIEEAKAAYYGGVQIMEDDVYDALVRLAATKGCDLSEAHTLRSAWSKVQHLRVMGSIGTQLRNDDEVQREFSGDVDVSLKYDGLAVELVYDRGVLTSAVLRGDGTLGEDVLDNVKHAEGVLARVSDTGLTGVYGELIISYNNLEALNEMRADDGLEPYKTPRNAVSMVRQTPGPMTGHRMKLMAFKAYDVWPRRDSTPLGVDAKLYALGYVKHVTRKRMKPSEVWDALLRLENRIRAGELQYQVDGLVVNAAVDHDHTAKIKPRPSSATTKVVDIISSLGVTGVISPVIVVEPVTLGGVTVTRVTGHNYSLMSDRLSGIGVGAEILVSRRGDVIPHAELVVTEAPVPWVTPTSCPSCGSILVSHGAHLKCSADPSDCSGTQTGLLLKYVRSVGIDGIGPSIASALVSSGLVTEPSHLYTRMDVELWSSLPIDDRELGRPIAERINASLWAKSKMSLDKLLGSLGIEGCATAVMEAVAAKFPGRSVVEASREALMAVDGLGPARADAIRAFMASRPHIFTDLMDVLDVTESTGTGPMSGHRVCITLGLSQPREVVEALIRQNGGEVSSSVTKKVTLLVCNFPDQQTGKLKDAARLNVPVISERQLREMIGAGVPPVLPSEDDPF